MPASSEAGTYTVTTSRPTVNGLSCPQPVEGGEPAKIRVVMNWYEEFRDRERD